MAEMLEALRNATFPHVRWDPQDKPILVADGRVYSIPKVHSVVEAASAYVVGITDRYFGHLCHSLRAEAVHFYEMKVQDLSPIRNVCGLQRLAIRWNTKMTSLSPLVACHGLRVLLLEDTPGVRDLAPVGHLSNLRALEFSGGMWKKNVAHTLEPLAALSQLEELQLLNIGVEQVGLRPLAGCWKLKQLVLSNQFPTEDYAYLSAKLPQVLCQMFAPYVQVEPPIDDKDIMVTGKRKPLLNSLRDSEVVQRYVREFEELRRRFNEE